MASAIFVNGPTLVRVKYATGSSDSPARTLSELGLATDAIKIEINARWYDVQADDYGNGGPLGGDVPPEILIMPADAIITMNLIHFDRDVLDTCMVSLGGNGGTIGQLVAAGTALGGGLAVDSGTQSLNKYISLNLSSPAAGKPWKFPAAYMMERPMEFPVGVEKSVVKLVWRAIPYVGVSVTAPTSGSKVLWTHTADDNNPLT